MKTPLFQILDNEILILVSAVNLNQEPITLFFWSWEKKIKVCNIAE